MSLFKQVISQINRVFAQTIPEDATEAEVANTLESLPTVEGFKESQSALDKFKEEFETFKTSALTTDAVQSLIDDTVKNSSDTLKTSLTETFNKSLDTQKKELVGEINKVKGGKTTSTTATPENLPGVKPEDDDKEDSMEVSMSDLFKPGQIIPGLI